MDTILLKTKEVLTKSELVDFYKDIAQQQSDNYTTLITVLLGITVVLVGSTWLWNFLVAKNQIKAEVLKTSNKNKEDLKVEIERLVNEKFVELDNSLCKKLKNNEAHLARLYAVNCSNQQLFAISISWWLTALRLYHETEDQTLIRVSVEQIIYNINQPDWHVNIPDTLDLGIAIQEVEELVPIILNTEKRQIINEFRLRIGQ
ncbi:MAG: hypothetical protein ACH34V_12435 [Flavobacterium sp.]|uniref:hypothetical protein n=1 Tax=Flavobacterium sp. TaxID=239 RepID=UPI0037B7AAC4